MPVFAPAPTSLQKPRKRNRRTEGNRGNRSVLGWALLLLALLGLLLGGCDRKEKIEEQELPPNLAREHARSAGEEVAQRTLRRSNEFILLHPQSDRQRMARENLLFLDELNRRERTTDSENR